MYPAKNGAQMWIIMIITWAVIAYFKCFLLSSFLPLCVAREVGWGGGVQARC